MCQPGRPRPKGASQAAPTDEVPGVLLGVFVRAHALAGPGPQLAPVELGEASVGREARDSEIDRAVLPLVRHPAVEQALDHLDHGTDVLGRAGLSVGRPDPEPVPVLLERAGEGFHVLAQRHALAQGRGNGAVVHIRQVHDMEDLEPARLQPSAQEVLEQEGAEVPDVRVVVDRGAAGVQRGPPRLQRSERLDPAGEGLVEPERHAPAAPAALRRRSGVESSTCT